MPALAEQYTVIAPDLRGSGGSDVPATGYDKASLAEDIHQLLLVLGHADEVSLVGHDIGAPCRMPTRLPTGTRSGA